MRRFADRQENGSVDVGADVLEPQNQSLAFDLITKLWLQLKRALHTSLRVHLAEQLFQE